MGERPKKIFCGIEGGASFSKVVLVKENGEVLCWANGDSTNYLLVGMDECQKRLDKMIEKVKLKANVSSDFMLESLGLCMSGCEQEEGNRKFEQAFLKKFPELTKNIIVSSDTVGSLITASETGGVVLIAGTGSNSLLINPDGSQARCGGWGHLLGDEASASWIALKGIKAVLDGEDNMNPSPYPVERVKQLMLDHYKVKDKFGLLEHVYVTFDKTYFAKLCAKMARVAVDDGDELCRHIFYEAGKALGNHINALLPKVDKSLLQSPTGLPILCVGSVFNSWDLLKDGFHSAVDKQLKCFTLLQLCVSSAIGAAYLGAKNSGFNLPLDFEKHCTVLYKQCPSSYRRIKM